MNRKIIVFVAGLALAATAAHANDRGGRPDFDALDMNGDGLLSADELDQLPSRGDTTGADRLARLDTDGDGFASQDELEQARQRMGTGKGGGHGGRPNFENFDTNGDGRLSREEMSQIEGPRGSLPPEMFDRMDVNDDGYVTKEEMQAMRQQRKGGHKDQGGPTG